MTSRAESIVYRDATVVYLEGQVEAYERSYQRINRDQPGPISGSGDDWAFWARTLRKDLAALIDHTKANLALAEAAERQREDV